MNLSVIDRRPLSRENSRNCIGGIPRTAGSAEFLLKSALPAVFCSETVEKIYIECFIISSFFRFFVVTVAILCVGATDFAIADRGVLSSPIILPSWKGLFLRCACLLHRLSGTVARIHDSPDTICAWQQGIALGEKHNTPDSVAERVHVFLPV